MSEGRTGFGRVYADYHAKVLAWAARFAGRDEAEDVAQEVFVKIARSLGSVADTAKLGSWIYAITRNTVRDAARRRATRPRLVPCAASGDATPEAGFERVADDRCRSPEEIAIRNEMVRCYMDLVAQLPRAYREVYVLSELEHLANEEIARRLCLTPGTVKIRLHRARARLNATLRCRCRPYYNERGELLGEPKRPDVGPLATA